MKRKEKIVTPFKKAIEYRVNNFANAHLLVLQRLHNLHRKGESEIQLHFLGYSYSIERPGLSISLLAVEILSKQAFRAIGTSTVVKEPTLFVRLKMNMLKLSSVITSGAILVRQFLLNTFAEELKLFIKAITTPSKLDSKHHTNNTNTNTNTNNNNNNNNNNNSSSSSSTFLFDASISSNVLAKRRRSLYCSVRDEQRRPRRAAGQTVLSTTLSDLCRAGAMRTASADRRHLMALLVYLVLFTNNTTRCLEEVVCGGFDIRNSPKRFIENLGPRARLQWRRCTVIEGDVRLILMTRDNMTQEDFNVAIMPNLREITGSVLVFQVVGLESLGALFPNLRIIRGNGLVYNYALVLFQNPNLREINLANLTEISKGGVRIVNNGELCYVNTILWSQLCREEDAHIVIEGNRDPMLCSEKCTDATNDAFCAQHTNSEGPSKACWNGENCQLACPPECSEKNLACNTTMETPFCCHRRCVGGCIGPTDRDCYACREVIYQGQCLDKCPKGLYELGHRRCINQEECISRHPVKDEVTGDILRYKALDAEGSCVLKCPTGYEEDPNDDRKCVLCQGVCLKKCFGGDVRSLAEAAQFKGCNIVLGPLDIMMQRNVAGKLEEYLGDIREITHYLKVSFSPSFVSLNMLKNLRIIRGQELWNDKYALSVFENEHLSKLWNFTSGEEKLHIENGKLQFHNNPNLCYRTIVELVEIVGQKDSEELEIEIERRFVGPDTIVLRWDTFNTSMMDHRMFLGYQLYYRPVDSENVSIVENRDACHDSWKMLFYQPSERGAFLSELKPYTLYAFYITTLMVNSPGARGGISKVVYVRTAFGHPSSIILKKVESRSPWTIYLEWEPPLLPNGEVTHYMISYVEKVRATSSDRNYCEEPPDYSVNLDKLPGSNSAAALHRALTAAQMDLSSWHHGSSEGFCSQVKCCECSATTISNISGPVPNHELLASEQKERAVFENIIHNIVFVSNRHKRQVIGPLNMDDDTFDFTSLNNMNGGGRAAYAVAFGANGAAVKPNVVNVTDTNFTIENLHHFTMYEIKIWACQNQSVAENHCSRREVVIMKNTMLIESKDAINDSSVLIYNASDATHDRFISWTPPTDPNGVIVSYEIEYLRNMDGDVKPKRDCITQNDFMEKLGFLIQDLPPGNYSFRIRALSLAQRANPEYISQLEVYKPDEWELKRGDIELLKEIGRGTFGTVYAGRGKNVRSVRGDTFGECAVKTVSDKASIYDRWHFLIEASVMKKFDTAFIVKLYGVVSEGQPALVVMEMMSKGNLKDYLRSRRPGAEENVHNLVPPTEEEMFNYAAEIADGMAYLEAIKFCHRDLAARNCMVSVDGSCKIGDFGMARDVYVKDYYRPQGRRLMPVRWMAPEALKDAKFTSKSDIWSYGVILWEIATLANQPYAGLANEEVMRLVVDHRKIMEKPKDCPKRMYDLMLLCWKYDPKDRPLFSELAASLYDDLPSQFKSISFCGKNGIKGTRISRRACGAGDPFLQCSSSQGHSRHLRDGGGRSERRPKLNIGIGGAMSISRGDHKAPLCKNNRVPQAKIVGSAQSWMKRSSPTRRDRRLASSVDPPEGNGALLNGHATTVD
ncbi:Insulin receptor [Trichinella pseudospiralis]|uniref:Tyrosine-protein kinase receptor n=1 Tax=Trichinella pseudospiralis TaxID=6337 RepID=A0A0V1JJX5_TRIPS|nr:Insulin receptor [Trichinella pseudospiralis]